MTQGARIKQIRKLRNLTQKQLGLLCGFSENTADVRIRQYENNTKIPKDDTLRIIASALKVNYRAIQNYDMGCAEDILETLFWLEESHGLSLFGLEEKSDYDNDWSFKGSYNYYQYATVHPPIGIVLNPGLVNDFMGEWFTRYSEYKRNEITREQYQNWKLNWPDSCDECIGTHSYVDWKTI